VALHGHVDEARLSPNYGHQWAYYSSLEPWLNDNDRGKPKNSEKNLPQYHFVHHKFHTDQGLSILMYHLGNEH
jgi:hypothetical protein